MRADGGLVGNLGAPKLLNKERKRLPSLEVEKKRATIPQGV